MIASIAFALLGAAVATEPCSSLTSLKLDRATVTSAQMVAEGPAPLPQGRAGGPPRAPARIPGHCGGTRVLTPTSDSLIKMELGLPPLEKWNGKFMGVGNGGFAGSIQGLANEMPQALRLGYATAGTDTGHQES